MRRLTVLALLVVAACESPPQPTEPIPVGKHSVARFVEVPAGAECAEGGQRLEVGVDKDGDGALGDDEVQSTALLCNGAAGTSAVPDLMRLVPGVLEACGGPGVRVEIGRDEDGDLLLDDDEVRDGGDLCDGAAGGRGGDALVDVANAAMCPAGGQLVRVGLDADDDGALSDDEVLTSRAVCDGLANDDAGPAGSDGAATLIEVVAESIECDAGGQRVRVGRDADGSGTLSNDEVSESVVLCNGVEGQGGEQGPGSGVSEGTADAPVPLVVSAFGDLSAGHPGSVAGSGRSYYGFTTRSDHGPMPYTIVLVEAETDLIVSVLAGDAAGAAVSVRCRDEVHGAAMARVCDTDELQPDAPHVVTVRDARNVANVYVLTVSAGAARGTTTLPMEIDASDIASADSLARGSVRELGESVYRFTSPLDDHLTITLEGVDAPDGDPLLRFDLYDGEARADLLLSSCAGRACPTASVASGADVLLVVSAGAPKAAAFDIRLSRGDDLTPVLPLDAVTPAAPVMQLSTAEAGGYSIYLAARHYTVSANAGDDVPVSECKVSGACLLELEGGKRYYLSASGGTDGRRAFARQSAGQEGSPSSPVPLTLDAARDCSTDQELNGYNGNVPAQSYYTFTTASAGPYAVDVTWQQPASNLSSSAVVYADALLTTPVEQAQVIIDQQRRLYMTEPLAAGSAYYVVVRSHDALTFDMTVGAGDAGMRPLPLDGVMTPMLVPATDVTWYRVDLAESGVVELTATGLDGALTFNAHTLSPASPIFRQVILSFDGTASVVLPAGTSYLQLATVFAQQIELGASLATITPLVLDVAHTRAGLTAGHSDWYRFESTVEGAHSLTVTHDTSGGGNNVSALQVYDDAAVLALEDTMINSETVPLLDGTTPLPVGSWLVRVRNGSTSLFIDYDLQVSAP